MPDSTRQCTTAVACAVSQARALRPCIVFMDEIDAVGRVRGGARGNDERDQTLNQMLSEMDGFDAESGVIVMAATNRWVVMHEWSSLNNQESFPVSH